MESGHSILSYLLVGALIGVVWFCLFIYPFVSN